MITAATEGWGALYDYDGVVIERMVAFWVQGGNDNEGLWFGGMVIDDRGDLVSAPDVERFICYKAPDDDPKEIVKRRAMSV